MYLKGKHLTLAVCMTALFFLSTFMAGVGLSFDVQVKPINPDFINYHNHHSKARANSSTDISGTTTAVTGIEMEASGNVLSAAVPGTVTLGLIPSTIDRSDLTGTQITPPANHLMQASVASTSAMPSSYDLRTLGRVSPVKDQKSCGSCWAFGTMGSMESDQMPTSTFDFSEHNLVDMGGYDLGPCDGGNAQMSSAYLARWSGPVSETDDPYSDQTFFSPLGLTVQKHIQDIMYIPDRANPLDLNNVKVVLQTYGGIYTTMTWDFNAFNSQTNSYYYSTYPNTDGGHAVTIVGWDDNYPATNFTIHPPANGAFIVKNSWGTGWGENGYFYASYYDPSFGRGSVAFYNAEPASNFGTVYQYDALGEVTSIVLLTGTNNNQPVLSPYFANIFTAEASHNITATGFYAESPNTTYTTYVYTNVTGTPTNGTLAETFTGTLPYPGYHSINFTTPVPVTQGQKFSIVVKLSAPSVAGQIAVSYPLTGYTSAATNNPGNSFISADGQAWTDATTLPNTQNQASVCLKAFSDGSTIPPAPECIYEVSPPWSTIYDAKGGSGTITVTAPTGCHWNVSVVPSWVTIQSGMSGTGSGTVSYTVTPNNTTQMKIDHIQVAGKKSSVYQNGNQSLCTFTSSPASSGNLSGAQGFYNYTVTTQAGCQMAPVVSQPSWLSVVGTPLSGTGTVTYDVQSNTTPSTRSATITIGTSVFTVYQLSVCNFTISPTSGSVGVNGGTLSVQATNPYSSCQWSVSNAPSWITYSTTTASGPGSATLTVAPNTTTTARTATVVVAGQSYTVNQAAPCSYTISAPSSSTLSGAGGTGTISVTTQTGCQWSVADTLGWATITSGASWTGSGNVSYSVTANTNNAPRTGTMTVAGKPYTVTQAAACTYSIGPAASTSVTSSGGALSVAVSTQSGCSWTSSNSLSWASISSGASGTGNGTVNINVTSNNNSLAGRTGSITIAGQAYSINQQAAPCTYAISPTTSTIVPISGGTVPITVTAPVGCTWTVSNSLPWATAPASGVSGTGSGTVSVSVAPNANYTTRTGTMTVAGHSFTVNQAASPCTYSINPTQSSTVGAGGGTVSVSVIAPTGCTWTASDTLGWSSIAAGTSGNGNGTVSVTVAGNASSVARTGNITVAGKSFGVSQAGVSCTYAINPASSTTIAGSGGTLSVSVIAPAGCGWSVSDPLNWASVYMGASGVGSGTVSISVGTNNSGVSTRTGTIAIAGQAFTVNQAAAPCTYAVSSLSSGTVPYTGSTATISVTAPQGCTWTVSDNLPWATVAASETSGTGSGTVSLSIDPNPNYTTRTGTITVAGQNYTISEAAAPCTYSISPVQSAQLSASGGIANITVTAPTGCTWTALSNLGWATIPSIIYGNGNGTVSVTVAGNTSSIARSGNIAVAGKYFTVSQSGVSCTYAINPASSATIAGSGGTVSVSVIAPAGCGWSVSDSLNWAPVRTGASGVGTGSVSISVAANDSSLATRTGNITIAGQSYKVNQAVAPCTYAVAPTSSLNLPYTGTTANVAVTAPIGCGWTVSDSLPWATVPVSATSGTGNGTVPITVAQNPNGTIRTGAVTIAGSSYSLSQMGIPCTYAISAASSAPIASSGGTATINVTAPTGCIWSVLDGVSWTSIKSGLSGNGNGTVSVSIAANTSSATRAGNIIIAGKTYAVSQLSK